MSSSDKFPHLIACFYFKSLFTQKVLGWVFYSLRGIMKAGSGRQIPLGLQRISLFHFSFSSYLLDFFTHFLAIRVIYFWYSFFFVALVGINGLLGPMTLHFPSTLETFLAFFISSRPLVLELQSPVRKSVWCCLMDRWAPPTEVFFPCLWFTLDSFKYLGFQFQWSLLLCVLVWRFSWSFMLEDWYLLLKIISVDRWCLVYLTDSSEFNENL